MLEHKWIVYLEQQKQAKFTFEKVDKAELVEVLLANIGDHNAHIRDDLIYPNLAHLLFDGHFTESELATYLHRLMGDEYLFFDIDNYIDFSVLVRSFSILQLAILVAVHNREGLISERSIKSLYTQFLKYFSEETVFTGYNDSVGWVHAIAHSADLFNQLMKVSSLGESELKTMFNAITNKIKTDIYYFQHDEDERLVVALKSGLDRDLLDEAFLLRWIDSAASFKQPKEFPARLYITNNVKNLLRSLYFKLLPEEKYHTLTEAIATKLQENVKLH